MPRQPVAWALPAWLLAAVVWVHPPNVVGQAEFLGHPGQTGSNPVAVSAGGELLLTAGDDGVVRVWDALSRDELATLAPAGGGTEVAALEIAPADGGDSAQVWVGHADGTIRRWPLPAVSPGAAPAAFTAPALTIDAAAGGDGGAGVALKALAVSAGGGFVVSLFDNELRTWDAATGAALNASGKLPGSADPCRCGTNLDGVAVAPDGSFIVAVGFGKGAFLLEPGTLTPAGPALDGAPTRVSAVTVTQDSRFVVGDQRKWDVATGELLHTFETGGNVLSVALARDDAVLFTGTDWPSAHVRAFDFETGAVLQEWDLQYTDNTRKYRSLAVPAAVPTAELRYFAIDAVGVPDGGGRERFGGGETVCLGPAVTGGLANNTLGPGCQYDSLTTCSGAGVARFDGTCVCDDPAVGYGECDCGGSGGSGSGSGAACPISSRSFCGDAGDFELAAGGTPLLDPEYTGPGPGEPLCKCDPGECGRRCESAAVEKDDAGRYLVFYIVAGLVTVLVLAGALYCFGCKVALVVLIALRIWDLMSDWAMYAITLHSDRFTKYSRLGDPDFGCNAGNGSYETVQSMSLWFSLVGTVMLVSELAILRARFAPTLEEAEEGYTSKRESWGCATISVTIVEDIPQLVITAVYLAAIQTTEGFDVTDRDDQTALTSLALSMLSIVINCCSGCRQMRKEAGTNGL